MKAVEGEAMDSIVVTITITVAGWFIAALVYVFDQGRKVGAMKNQIDSIQKQVAEDRAEFKKMLQKIDSRFFDSDNNQRFITVPDMHTWCNQSHAVCGERIAAMIANIKKDQEDRLQRDHEIFKRLRSIEGIVARIGAEHDLMMKKHTSSAVGGS